jgi:hypothetical protein
MPDLDFSSASSTTEKTSPSRYVANERSSDVGLSVANSETQQLYVVGSDGCTMDMSHSSIF